MKRLACRSYKIDSSSLPMKKINSRGFKKKQKVKKFSEHCSNCENLIVDSGKIAKIISNQTLGFQKFRPFFDWNSFHSYEMYESRGLEISRKL